MTHRDLTPKFKELRRLYQPHSIKIKDISNIIRSAAHRAEAKFNTSKFAQKFRTKDPYHNSDDSEEGISLLKTNKSKNSDSEDSSSSSDDSDDDQKRKLPLHLSKALEHTPLWMELLGRIDENAAMIEHQC